MQQLNLSEAVRQMLASAEHKHKIMDALKWQPSDVSRFLSDSQGIPLNKLDVLLKCIGFIPVEKRYLSAVQTLCQVGSQCYCAQNGMGMCGGNQ